MKTILKASAVYILFICSIVNTISAQNMEVDFGIGLHLSNINFHHTSEVDSDEASEFQAFNNSNFKLGITTSLGRKNLFLKTELGFIKTNAFFGASYKYDEGFGEQRITRISYLTNQKIYLGILPEYRLVNGSLTIKLSGGILLSSDISNTYSTSNTILLPKSNPLGIRIGGGFQYMWNKIGIECIIAFAKFGQSELQNRWHPKVSYDLLLFNWGIVYSL